MRLNHLTKAFFFSLCFVAIQPSLASPSFFSERPSGKDFGHNDRHIRDRIMAEFTRWEGVKYQLGGNSKNGIDCSALMQEIVHSAFSDIFPERLPRTTASQISAGRGTSRGELRPGDLVFFQMSSSERHVGIFIGGDQFIHASTSRGVVVSNFDNAYWKTRYTTARRLLS